MRRKFLDRRIPSFAGLILLAISIGMVSWYGKQFTQIFTRASAGEAPKNVQISNITDTSFTVSYTTDDATISTLAYAKDANLGQVALDARDQQTSSASAHNVHYFNVSGLSVGTKYFFAIQSGSSTFLNNGLPYEATTRSVPFDSKSNQSYVVTGPVHLPDGNIPPEGIVYLSTAASGSAQLSVLLQPNGNYSFNDLRAFYPLEDETVLKLTVTSGILESHVSALTKFANPVPLITLSKDYDFSSSSPGSGELTTIANPELGFPLNSKGIASGPAILTPQDAEKFKDAQPLFQGTAVPGETVEITIQSNQEIQISVQADNLGNWEFRPDIPLDPGEHIIIIVTKDINGILRTIKKSFTVYASGSQFADTISPTQAPSPSVVLTATPEATVAIQPVPITPTRVPTASPTAMLTLTVVPTTTITPTPAILQPTVTVAPTPIVTTAPLAPTGSFDIFVGGGIAILLFIAGAFMLFFL